MYRALNMPILLIAVTEDSSFKFLAESLHSYQEVIIIDYNIQLKMVKMSKNYWVI